MIEERYLKNIGSLFTQEDQTTMLLKTCGIIGAGGNGGYLIEFLARLGVKKIIIFDGDNFDFTNLNRQIYCNVNTIGLNKAEVAKIKINEINPKIKVEAYSTYAGNNYNQDLNILSQCDIIFYEADPYINICRLRSLLKELLVNYNIPIVEGAVINIGIYLKMVTKEDIDYFNLITQELIQQQPLVTISQPAFLCALIACEKINMAIKYFCGKSYEKKEVIFNTITNEVIKENKY